MLRRTLRVTLLGALLIGATVPAPVRGQDGPSVPTQEGALFLLLPVGAQAIGVARAVSALESHESAFWNPAGLARVESSRVLVFHGSQITGDGTGASVLLARPGAGTLAFSYHLLDEAGQNVTDEFGSVVGEITVRGHQGILSIASPILTWMSVGANVKLVSSGVNCRGQCPEGSGGSTTYAFDTGVQIRPLGGVPFTVGIALAHLGPRFQEDRDAESRPLPARVRAGVSYLFTREFLEEEFGFRILAEFEDRVRDPGDPLYLLGSEFTIGTDDRLFIRGGLVFGNRRQTDGAALGLGLRYDRVELGVARSVARGGPMVDQEPIHLTLGLSF